jgi:hypothetical protein
VTDAREARIAELIGAVARQVAADRGVLRVALLDDGGPEAGLAARILAAALGEANVFRATTADGDVESVLHLAPWLGERGMAEELRRLVARAQPDSVAANPANKTALLLGGELPPEPFLPLGDLWASEVAALCGGWSAPDGVTWIAESAGGIDMLDDALRGLIDRREPNALDALPAEAAEAVRAALAAGRASRLNARVVPKIGSRTLGVDLFE